MQDIESTARAAKQLYDDQLREQLERTHLHCFCAIEPTSGDYFLGGTLSEAATAARKAYPNRPFHTVRVGHAAAVHIGTLNR